MKKSTVFTLCICSYFSQVSLFTNAATNTGASDFGRVVSPSNMIGEDPCTTITSKYVTPSTAKNNALVKGDIYVMLLKRVHIDKEFVPDGKFNKKGEIAIIANAFEMKPEKSSAVFGMDFSKSAADSGRVIYYSDDVKGGQFLNFGQLIMFGPIEYRGNPLGISIFGLELDSTKKAENVTALITSLAELGSKFSGPTSPVFGVLQELGTSLVRNNKDDLLFRYDTTVLTPEDARPNLYTVFGMYGEYIMIRSEDRTKVINWNDYSYRPSSGVLYNQDSCIAGNEFKGTYGVIQINKASVESHASYSTLKAFKDALDKAEEGDTAVLQTSLDKIKVSFNEADLYKRSLKALNSIENATRMKPPTDKEIAEFKKSLAIVKESLAVQIDTTNKVVTKTYLNKDQISNMLAQIGRLNKTDRIISEDDFDNAEVFNMIEANWK